MKNINQNEWQELISNDDAAIIIDVRTPNECAEGILKDAIMIDVLNEQNFITKAKTLEKEKNYYVYCRSGARSARACQILESFGIKSTYNLLGGILAWQGKTNVPV